MIHIKRNMPHVGDDDDDDDDGRMNRIELNLNKSEVDIIISEKKAI